MSDSDSDSWTSWCCMWTDRLVDVSEDACIRQNTNNGKNKQHSHSNSSTTITTEVQIEPPPKTNGKDKGKLSKGIPVKGKHSLSTSNADKDNIGNNSRTKDKKLSFNANTKVGGSATSSKPKDSQKNLHRPEKYGHSSFESPDDEIEYEGCFDNVERAVFTPIPLYSSPCNSDSDSDSYNDEEYTSIHYTNNERRIVVYDSGAIDPSDAAEYHYTDRIMTGITDQERRVILEFCHLLEKSKQFFNGLRELSPYGQKHWQGQFSRTFDVYAKLWKFQQQKRSTLDVKYGLKRWQIGEIASKIGQLYYHFYLRTSETAYLVEAYSFYSAIRGRRYYTLAIKENKCELMVKKLRFYARYIVVAILLQLPDVIDELLLELESQVTAYGKAYDPNDQVEWSNVLAEVRAFLSAEPGVTIRDPDNKNKIITVNGRINPLSIPPIEMSQQICLTLRDAVIIGSGTQLVKFSELTIDMFRMVQLLEFEITVPIRDPSNSSPKQDGKSLPPPPPPPPPPPLSIFDGTQDHDGPYNPHKFLLFKPSPSQALIYLGTSCNELPVNGALLVYVSAHGHAQHIKHPENYAYDLGGLITTSDSDVYNEDRGVSSKHRDPQILYPGDLQPFTRKPLFVIIDSDNSFAFQHIPRTFGQPLVVLMSPIDLPPSLTDRSEQGNLFTLFLHNPIAGLCNSCDVFTISVEVWDHCVQLRDIFMRDATRLILRIRLDPMHYAFIDDDFLRLILIRYIFCECTLRLHRAFRSRNNLPRASPPIPDEIFENRDLTSLVLEMADCVGVRSHFYDATKCDNE